MQENTMGRKKEFKAAKSFTIGISELAWLSEYCETRKIKASEFVNKLIRREMLDDKQEKVKAHGPITFCTGCSNTTEFEFIENKWLCKECQCNKTEVIQYQLKQQSNRFK